MLRAAGRSDVSVEIVFPVSPEAITTDKQAGAAQVCSAAARLWQVDNGLVGGQGPGCQTEGPAWSSVAALLPVHMLMASSHLSTLPPLLHRLSCPAACRLCPVLPAGRAAAWRAAAPPALT